VKRALVLTALLAIAAVGGALAYRSAARDRSYRLLIASGDTEGQPGVLWRTRRAAKDARREARERSPWAG